MAPLLKVDDLATYFYTQGGVVKAVDGISYEVARGETIALMGESGCGKTTSALSILRLLPASQVKIVAGQVLFDGVDLLKASKKEMRKVRGGNISMIFQEPMTSLNPVLTIGRQISEVLELHQNMKRRETVQEVIRLLNLVGIPQAERRMRDYPHHFSGGMRQRVMIAIAISCRPKLIIADEPTTAVDVTIQAQLLELLRGITRELNTSLILITHNLGIVARYAQRIYVMYAGRIVEHGPAQDVYRYPGHPYTAGLLASVPRLDEPRKTRLTPVEGQPPDPLYPPPGCPFQPRCTYGVPQCQRSKGDFVEVTSGHYSSCCLAQNGVTPWEKT